MLTVQTIWRNGTMNLFMLQQALKDPQADLERVKNQALALILDTSVYSQTHWDAIFVCIEAYLLSGDNAYANLYARIVRDRARSMSKPLYEATALRLIILSESDPELIEGHLQDLEKLAVERVAVKDMHQALLAQLASALHA